MTHLARGRVSFCLAHYEALRTKIDMLLDHKWAEKTKIIKRLLIGKSLTSQNEW